MSKYLLTIFIFLAGSGMWLPTYTQAKLPHADPTLLQLAQTNPEQLISVIVQQEANKKIAAHWLARSNAKVTKDLSLIHGFVAVLPARDIVTLAHAPGVRWVSLDAPMKSTQTTPGFGELGAIKGKFNQSAVTLATTIQSDGKVLTVGASGNGIDDDILVARFKSDGTPDLIDNSNRSGIIDGCPNGNSI